MHVNGIDTPAPALEDAKVEAEEETNSTAMAEENENENDNEEKIKQVDEIKEPESDTKKDDDANANDGDADSLGDGNFCLSSKVFGRATLLISCKASNFIFAILSYLNSYIIKFKKSHYQKFASNLDLKMIMYYIIIRKR